MSTRRHIARRQHWRPAPPKVSIDTAPAGNLAELIAAAMDRGTRLREVEPRIPAHPRPDPPQPS